MIAACPKCGEPLRKPRRKRIRQALPGVSRKDDRSANIRFAAARRKRVYAAVDKRSGGECEMVTTLPDGVLYCLSGLTDTMEHDHFWGRGKAKETPRSVWLLCKFHHDNKTANDPDRAAWIRRFRDHCHRHGFWEEVAKCDRALALEEAQHARPSPPRDGRQNTKGAAPVDAATKGPEGETT